MENKTNPITAICAAANVIATYAEHIKEYANGMNLMAWHPHTEIPADGLYIVATESGAVFVSQPLGGKWISTVRWWMELPVLPTAKPSEK